jgi:putative membrane protein
MHAGLVAHILHLVVYAVAVLVAAKIVPGIRVPSFGSALLFAFVFAIVDKLLFWVLVFFTFPMVLLSFGLFVLVINGLLWKLADGLTPGVHVDGFGSAFLGALVTSVLSTAGLWALGIQ